MTPKINGPLNQCRQIIMVDLICRLCSIKYTKLRSRSVVSMLRRRIGSHAKAFPIIHVQLLYSANFFNLSGLEFQNVYDFHSRFRHMHLSFFKIKYTRNSAPKFKKFTIKPEKMKFILISFLIPKVSFLSDKLYIV